MGSPEITKTLRSQPQARGCFLHMEKMIGSLTIQSRGTLRVTSTFSPWRRIVELIPRSGFALFVPMNTMQQQMVAVWHSKSSQMIGCALCVHSPNQRMQSRMGRYLCEILLFLSPSHIFFFDRADQVPIWILICPACLKLGFS